MCRIFPNLLPPALRELFGLSADPSPHAGIRKIPYQLKHPAPKSIISVQSEEAKITPEPTPEASRGAAKGRERPTTAGMTTTNPEYVPGTDITCYLAPNSHCNCRLLAAGVKVDKEDRKESVDWFSPSPSLYNEVELLVVALLVELRGFESFGREKWLKAALLPTSAESVVADTGSRPESPDWVGRGAKPSFAHLPLQFVLQERKWKDAELEQVAKAIQVKVGMCNHSQSYGATILNRQIRSLHPTPTQRHPDPPDPIPHPASHPTPSPIPSRTWWASDLRCCGNTSTRTRRSRSLYGRRVASRGLQTG